MFWKAFLYLFNQILCVNGCVCIPIHVCLPVTNSRNGNMVRPSHACLCLCPRQGKESLHLPQSYPTGAITGTPHQHTWTTTTQHLHQHLYQKTTKQGVMGWQSLSLFWFLNFEGTCQLVKRDTACLYLQEAEFIVVYSSMIYVTWCSADIYGVWLVKH